MGLVDISRQHFQRFTERKSDFGQGFTITTPDGLTTAALTGLITFHHSAFDANTGALINSKIASVAVSEKSFTDAGYNHRVNGVVSLERHRVTFTDASGLDRDFEITEFYPDNAIGCIVLILGMYAG